MFFKFIKIPTYIFFISLFQNQLFAQKTVWKQIQIPAEETNSNELDSLIMRPDTKGFGHSCGGVSRYLNDSCTSPPYLLRTKQASYDLKEAISYLATMPQFDTSKTIVIGVSMGGLAILGLTDFPHRA
jgi:hypothetical protein